MLTVRMNLKHKLELAPATNQLEEEVYDIQVANDLESTKHYIRCNVSIMKIVSILMILNLNL